MIIKKTCDHLVETYNDRFIIYLPFKLDKESIKKEFIYLYSIRTDYEYNRTQLEYQEYISKRCKVRKEKYEEIKNIIYKKYGITDEPSEIQKDKINKEMEESWLKWYKENY